MDNNLQSGNESFPKPGPLAAVVVVFFEVFVALFGFAYLQYYLGMWGLVLTELGCAAIAFGAAKVVGLSIKEMLPFKKIKVNEFFGTLLMWGGSLFTVVIVNLVFFYFFPEGLGVGEDLNSFTSEWPAAAALFVVSVMPAFCEEFLHRGFIQRCLMRKVHGKFLISFIMALFFGLFHLDFYRFLATGFLGGVMAYILVETENFWYNVLFHFTNNFFAQSISIWAVGRATEGVSQQLNSDMILICLASYCVIGCVAPLLLCGGSMLLKGKKKLLAEGKTKIIVSTVLAAVLAGIIFTTGVIMFGYFMYTGQMRSLMEGLK